MPKEILIYTDFYRFTAAEIIKELDAAKNDDLTIRVNTYGGDPHACFGVIRKMAEHKKSIDMKVDGHADSMGAYMLCCAKNVECLPTSEFTLHRAAYMDESQMDPAMMQTLQNMNAFLRALLEKKIDPAKLFEMKGVTMDQMFNMANRVDVKLTAEEALSIGLVNKVMEMDEMMLHAINKRMRMAASTLAQKIDEQIGYRIAATTTEPPKQINTNIMTVEELKAKHPEVYNSVFALGVTQERDRVGAWMVYAKIDPEAVQKGIESKEAVSQKVMAEMSMKALSPEMLAKLRIEAAPAVVTQTPAATTQAKPEVIDFEKALNTRLGIKDA